MPIVTIQRRMAEQGRIRLGQKVTGTSKQGKAYTRPAKLETFRFTSPSERYIRDLAELYGGTAQAWDNGGMAQWEVFTEAKTIPVIAVKGGLSQWMETWSGGGVAHRCDGERDVAGNPCNPDDPAHQQAKPTTRLSVMLPELEALGVWRLETHGWNAAAEIPAVAELATYVGDLVPAHLHLVERRAIADGKTSRFVVPVLDLQIGTARLKALVAEKSGTVAAVEQPERVAIEVPRPDYAALIAGADSPQACRQLWADAGAAGHLDDGLKAAITARAGELGQQARPAAEEDPWQSAGDEPVDAEVVEGEEHSREQAWMQLLQVAGSKSLGGQELAVIVHDTTGRKVEDASAADFAAVEQMLRTGEVAEAVTA